MKYILKKDKAEELRNTYKNKYICEVSGLSNCYVSLILNRKRTIQKKYAYVFTKAINNDLEINDLFEVVK